MTHHHISLHSMVGVSQESSQDLHTEEAVQSSLDGLCLV